MIAKISDRHTFTRPSQEHPTFTCTFSIFARFSDTNILCRWTFTDCSRHISRWAMTIPRDDFRSIPGISLKLETSETLNSLVLQITKCQGQIARTFNVPNCPSLVTQGMSTPVNMCTIPDTLSVRRQVNVMPHMSSYNKNRNPSQQSPIKTHKTIILFAKSNHNNFCVYKIFSEAPGILINFWIVN